MATAAEGGEAGAAAPRRCRVGIVGYGGVGAAFVDKILHDPAVAAKLELAFVWNRSADKLSGLPADLVLHDLADFAARGADLVVEVCHPAVAKEHGPRFLAAADFFVGSPTAFADADTDAALRAAVAAGPRSVYVPVGALWGGNDLARLAAHGQLASLAITMKKHPASLKLEGALAAKLAAAAGADGEVVLFDGPVRELARLAPNNVNTMAAAAIGCPCLGFDGVVGRLVSDRSLDAHVIYIDAGGPRRPDGTQFRVTTTRVNPAPPGAVTGAATYTAFLGSLLDAAADCTLRRAAAAAAGGGGGGVAPATGRVHVC
jgi:aspartate dehydrogenase